MKTKQRHKWKKKKHSKLILQIEELGWHGDGIADLDGKKIYVPFALADEKISALVSGERAKILDILQASPDRVEPQCLYFGACGGCAVQHLEFQTYIHWKRQVIVRALLNRHIKVHVENLIDAHGRGRRRAVLHVYEANGQVQVGFMQARSQKLVVIKSCPILAPELTKATDIARDIAKYLLNSGKALNIQLTVSETGLDCTIIGAKNLDLSARMGLSDCASNHDLARLSVGNEIVLERRPPILFFGKGKVVLPPISFLQATDTGEKILANLVLDAVNGANRVADLYCGLGPFSMRMAAHSSVMSFDSDVESIQALKTALDNVQGQKPVTTEVRDLSKNPLNKSELEIFDAVVFNPPRAGAELQAREIASSEVPRVISVSCNAATFARDALILIDGGYRLARVTPVDQFRFAGHVEMVGVFERT